MKVWQGALLGWSYIMAAYVGSFFLGRDFTIAMMLAGVWALGGGFVAWTIWSANRDAH
jgi:hypothetical protein